MPKLDLTFALQYPVNLTISADAGNCYVNVSFGDKEEKYIVPYWLSLSLGLLLKSFLFFKIAEGTLATMTVKELKRKLGKQLPETTDRRYLLLSLPFAPFL